MIAMYTSRAVSSCRKMPEMFVLDFAVETLNSKNGYVATYRNYSLDQKFGIKKYDFRMVC